MANKAQEQLQDLLSMQSDAETAQGNLAKLNDARTEFVASGGDEAEFAWPEAAATAVGIGWVLGPVGGLAIGIAAGFLGKQAKQAALDEYAADIDSITRIGGVFTDQFERMALTASDADMLQISGMQTRMDVAQQMMGSADQEMQAAGMQAMQTVGDEMAEYSVRQETQQIASDAADKQMRRDMDKDTYAKHTGLLNRFEGRLGDFDMSIATADNIIEAINKGDGASVTASLATLPLLVNPSAGATSEGEVEIWAGIRGTIDALQGKAARELGAGGLTDATRKEILGVANQWKRNTISSAQAVEADFGDRLVAEKIPQQYWAQYNRTGKLREVQQGGFVPAKEMTEDSATALAVEDTGGLISDTIDETSMFIGDLADGTVAKNLKDRFNKGKASVADWYSGSGRDKRNAQTAERQRQRQTN